MAERSFPLPDLGEGLIDATVLEWLVAEGDFVERNAPLVEVETTKASVELPSPLSGTILRLHAGDGDVVRVGQPLVTFTVPDTEAGIIGTVPAQKPATRRVRLAPPE